MSNVEFDFPFKAVALSGMLIISVGNKEIFIIGFSELS